MERVGRILFALPFLAAGSYMLLNGLWNEVWALVVAGLLFIGFGLSEIVRAILLRKPIDPLAHAPRTNTAMQRLAQPPGRGGYRQSERRDEVTAEAFYHPVLRVSPLGRSTVSRGSTLAWRINPTPEQQLAFRMIFSLVWSAVSVGVIVLSIGSRQFIGVLVGAVFTFVGGLVWFPIVRRVLALRRLPRVEISAEPVFLGDELDVLVRCRPSESITRLEVNLECREIARYSEGTTTRTEEHRVWAHELLSVQGDEASREHRLRGRLTRSAPHSFHSANNTVEWSVRVRADLPAWPDYDEHLVFRALPRPGA